MQVNKNGVVSFGRKFTDLPSSETEFPLPDAPPFIAIFWGAIDLSNGRNENLFVREMNSTHNAAKLEEASIIICDNIFGGKFSEMFMCEPQSIFAASWKSSHSIGLNMVSFFYRNIFVDTQDYTNSN